MGFVNPVVDSDDEDDDIFEPERSFSGIFNTFVNQWYVKKDKNEFMLAFRFHAFPAILEIWETQTHNQCSTLRRNAHVANYSILIKPGN